MKGTDFVTQSPKKKFPNISSLSFEHPTDAAALVSLRKIPGIDIFLRFMFKMVQEKRTRLLYLSSTVRVSEKQFGNVNKLYQEALEIIDFESKPELYIAQSPIANAFAFGVDVPFIVIHSALIDMLEKDELQAVIAHELGHILSGHMLYYSVLLTLLNILKLGGLGIPFGNLALSAIIVALFEWFRKAELTCDRVGLLVAQNLDTSFRLNMKLAGGKHTENMDIEEFFKQADEYETQGDIIDSIYKVINNWQASHPHVVSRIRELQRWHDEGSYKQILNGNYITRDDAKHTNIDETWKRAINSARKDLRDSGDSLASILTGITDIGEDLFKRGSTFVSGLFYRDNPNNRNKKR